METENQILDYARILSKAIEAELKLEGLEGKVKVEIDERLKTIPLIRFYTGPFYVEIDLERNPKERDVIDVRLAKDHISPNHFHLGEIRKRDLMMAERTYDAIHEALNKTLGGKPRGGNREYYTYHKRLDQVTQLNKR
jgi:hypothetical protein